QAVRDELIYRFPFEQFAELTLAANYLGMFRRFMDLCGNKEEFLPRYVHAYWEISEHSWIQLQQQGALDPKVMQRISKVCRELVQIGLREAMAYYPRTGIRGATLDNELNRVWRDIFTASQHVIFR